MLTYADIQKAYARIRPLVSKTPLLELRSVQLHPMSPILFNVHVKLENAHAIVNAFKVRGVWNKLLRMQEEKHLPGIIVTAAMGSHGFAMGEVCRQLDSHAVCFMPETSTLYKQEKMRDMVSRLHLAGKEFSETVQIAMDYAQRKGYSFIHPYNDEDIIAGQGTIGIEIASTISPVSAVYLPIGGGGLASGVAFAMKAIQPWCRIVGVQPWDSHDMADRILGQKTAVGLHLSSVAEPLCITIVPQAITPSYVRQYVDDFILVDNHAIALAMWQIYKRTGHMVEGAGAIALAAAFQDEKRPEGPIICIVSGSNIDEEGFRNTLQNYTTLLRSNPF